MAAILSCVAAGRAIVTRFICVTQPRSGNSMQRHCKLRTMSSSPWMWCDGAVKRWRWNPPTRGRVITEVKIWRDHDTRRLQQLKSGNLFRLGSTDSHKHPDFEGETIEPRRNSREPRLLASLCSLIWIMAKDFSTPSVPTFAKEYKRKISC